jgi:uncharacterized protein DUF4337
MSEEEFHVHGPHDHAVEHGAEGGDGLAGHIAVMTALLSTIGAIFSYQGGVTQNEALLHKNQSILYKNESVLKKTEASDQWNYYQAKGNKQNLSELAAAIAPAGRKAFYEGEVTRYKGEKEEIKKRADALELEVKKYDALSAAEDQKSAEALHPHERLALATTMVQIAISLAAITVLTRKIWLFWVAGVAAVLGIGLWVTAGGVNLLGHLLLWN